MTKNTFILLCLTALLCRTSGYASDFEEAARAYEKKAYPEAIATWEADLASRGESAAVRHNLALSYFQTNAFGEAVWQMERAHRLAPFDQTIIAKLKLVKMQQNLPSSDLTWYAIGARYFSLNQWALLCSFFFWVVVAAVWLWPPAMSPRSKYASIVAVSAAAGLAICITGTYLSYRDAHVGTVVHADKVPLTAAPASAAPTVAHLNAGANARVIDKHREFYRVKTERGTVGWIHSDDFRLIVTPSET